MARSNHLLSKRILFDGTDQILFFKLINFRPPVECIALNFQEINLVIFGVYRSTDFTIDFFFFFFQWNACHNRTFFPGFFSGMLNRFPPYLVKKWDSWFPRNTAHRLRMGNCTHGCGTSGRPVQLITCKFVHPFHTHGLKSIHPKLDASSLFLFERNLG